MHREWPFPEGDFWELACGYFGMGKQRRIATRPAQAAPRLLDLTKSLSGTGPDTRMGTPQTEQFGAPTCSMTAGTVLNSRPQRGHFTLTMATTSHPAAEAFINACSCRLTITLVQRQTDNALLPELEPFARSGDGARHRRHGDRFERSWVGLGRKERFITIVASRSSRGFATPSVRLRFPLRPCAPHRPGQEERKWHPRGHGLRRHSARRFWPD